MVDSTAAAPPAAETKKEEAPATPLYRRLKGYSVEGKRAARYAVERGLGVVDFGEPTAGEWDEFHHGRANGARSVDSVATALRACVKRATGSSWPKPEEDLARWTAWFRGLPLSSANALDVAVCAFMVQMNDADQEEAAGNG